eukprot:scaffold254515_cov34-Prasinocladus_malaysianus.AAC.2
MADLTTEMSMIMTISIVKAMKPSTTFAAFTHSRKSDIWFHIYRLRNLVCAMAQGDRCEIIVGVLRRKTQQPEASTTPLALLLRNIDNKTATDLPLADEVAQLRYPPQRHRVRDNNRQQLLRQVAGKALPHLDRAPTDSIGSLASAVILSPDCTYHSLGMEKNGLISSTADACIIHAVRAFSDIKPAWQAMVNSNYNDSSKFTDTRTHKHGLAYDN